MTTPEAVPSRPAVESATHAVLAAVHGVPVKWVSPTYCQLAKGYRLTKQQLLVHGLAPQEAVRQLLYLDTPPSEPVHGDVYKAAGFAKRADVHDLTPYHSQARFLVRKHDQLIWCIAGALDRHGTIPGEGIVTVCKANGVSLPVAKYRPDQERDDHGRFADEGGGGGKGKQPKTKADWGKVAAVASDIALVAGLVALTGPGGLAAAAGSFGARGLGSLARTGPGAAALGAIGAGIGPVAGRIYAAGIEPLLRRSAQMFGLDALRVTYETARGLGMPIPKGATLHSVAVKFGVIKPGQRLPPPGNAAVIGRVVGRGIRDAKRKLQEWATAIGLGAFGVSVGAGVAATRNEKRALQKRLVQAQNGTLLKYRPDQERDDHGRFEDEGGGGGPTPETGLQRAGRYALTGAAVLGGAALASRGLGAASRAMHRRTLAGRVGREAAYRRHLADAEARRVATQAARMRGMTPAQMRREAMRQAARDLAGGTQRGAARVDAAAQRGINAATAKLPPKVRDKVREELSHGATGPDPAGKLIELPSWLHF